MILDIGIAVGIIFIIAVLHTYLYNRALEKVHAQYRARQEDLLNRLAARSYSEYAAFEQAKIVQVEPPAQPRRLTDETGLIEIEYDE